MVKNIFALSLWLCLISENIESIEELDQSVNINEAFETSISVGKHAFARMEVDVDRNKKKSQTNLLSHQVSWQQEKQKRWQNTMTI